MDKAPPEKTYRNEGWLRNKYLSEKKSIYEISDEIGWNRGTIWNWLKRFDIPTRDHAGDNANYIDIPEKLKIFLDGSLLGDGSLQSYRRSACYRMTQKHKKYVVWLREFLERYGFVINSKFDKKIGSLGQEYYRLRTLNYRGDLFNMWQRWYPDGKKTIPKDIILTPLALRQWYIGDGDYDRGHGSKGRIKLTTHGFSINGVKMLVRRLGDVLGTEKVNLNLNKQNQPYIMFGSAGVVDKFFDYIKPLPDKLIEDYSYKWPQGFYKGVL